MQGKYHIRRHDIQRRHSNCIIRYAEGSSRGLLLGSVSERAWRGKERSRNMSVMLITGSAEIRNINLPITSQQR